jgi:hypothetical protein
MTKNREQLRGLLNTRRFATTIGLAGLAAVHIMDLPGKWAETQYLAFGYIGIIVMAGLLIERMLKSGQAFDYLASAGLAIAVIAGFIVNRTVGMPGATDDIGNWFEPLALLSLFVEVFTVYQAVEGYRIAKRLLALA